MLQELGKDHDRDLERSDWEGMSQKTPEFEGDDELYEFLLLVKKEFWTNKNEIDVESAASSLVEKLGEEGMKEYMPMVERHFIQTSCALHDRVLVCDESKITGEGDEVSIAISKETLKEHLKWFLGEKEWALIEGESLKRSLAVDKKDAGTAG